MPHVIDLFVYTSFLFIKFKVLDVSVERVSINMTDLCDLPFARSVF